MPSEEPKRRKPRKKASRQANNAAELQPAEQDARRHRQTSDHADDQPQAASAAANGPGQPTATDNSADVNLPPVERWIEIVSARTHNLKNISTRIPHRRMTVITGVSGSGKSSLAFDTLYAEGQMRYVESMSAYSRQFLERMTRPDVERISGILPAIALEQKNTVKNARSTIGTATEINDYLRLLFANAGETICPGCGRKVERFTIERAVEALADLGQGRRVTVTSTIGMEGAGSFASLKAELQRGGFTRILLGGQLRQLEDVHLADIEAQISADSAQPAQPPAGAAAEPSDFDEDEQAEASHRLDALDDEAEEGDLLESLADDEAAEAGAEADSETEADEEPIDASSDMLSSAGLPGIRLKDDDGDEQSGEPDQPTEAGASTSTRADAPAANAAASATEQLSGPLHRQSELKLEVVVDRYELRSDNRARAAESLETAFKLGGGRCTVRPADGGPPVVFDTRFNCEACGREFIEPHAELFSFNSAYGACPSCEGFGRISGLDPNKIIPNPMLSLGQGAVAPWTTPAYEDWMLALKTACRRNKINLNVPFADLPEKARRLVWEGDGDDFPGIRGFFEWLETKRYKVHVRVMIARYRGYTTCPNCNGQRLRPEALSVKIGGRSIADLWQMSVKDLRQFFGTLTLSQEALDKSDTLKNEISSRLRYLDDVGLSYLTLDRQTRTLSGGESQRINLASALGSSLTSTLYVLDEPTVGLHPRDSKRLLNILYQLIAKGNTVVVVEHDPEVIEGAHHVLDLGPGAGEAGGQIVFEGTFADLVDSPKSVTGRALQQHTQRAISPYDRKPRGMLTIRGARAHNLKNIDAEIPIGVFTCVTGVSGSGKSTLIHDILHASWEQQHSRSAVEVGEHAAIEGWEQFDDVIMVDQSPIGRSTRSNPVTYVKAYDEIRRLLASTTRAKVAGVKAADFSFNVTGGRCEECKGVGTLTYDMYFLADVTVVCSQCNGKKFQKRVLDVKMNGRNIDDMLNMTIQESLKFFHGHQRIIDKLQPLMDVGLGYLRLGQNTATLSGGEAQRLKLASFLAAQKRDTHYLLLFDEPTTGLHMADVRTLLQVFQRLVNAGHTVLVIEHNLDLITQCDWIIDLGPEGGDGGGEIVAAGSVRQIARNPRSHTGTFLRKRILAAELE